MRRSEVVMAKFQLCQFKRTHDQSEWEKGIAQVLEFGYHDIAFIVDQKGDKVKKLFDYYLLCGYAHTTIDTEEVTAFYRS